MTTGKSDRERVTDLESALAHLQNDYDSLNEMVLKDGQRIDQLQALIKRLSDRLDAPSEPDVPRDPLDEKPPHY